MPFKKYYIFLAAISIWRGFCMSGRKLSDPTTYMDEKYPNGPHPTLLRAQEAGTLAHDPESPFPGIL
jgi:hypothetical protein